MNTNTYRLVFSKRLHSLVPVAEFVTSDGKSAGEACVAGAPGVLMEGQAAWQRYALRIVPGMRAMALALAVTIGSLSPASFAQVPTGGVIQTGAGTISGDNKNLLIQQASQKLGIDWQSYNIGAGNRVRYEQPNAQAIALNRVIGNNRSEIYGAIDANGQIFLINPNGILFGRTAEVNVGGLFASTRDISQADFAAGKYSFSGTGDASIINQGQLKALEGGSIVLAGREVRNEGNISADKGRVVLAAGETINLSLDTNNQLTVVVNATAANALVDNSGLITANNGQVYLTAKGRDMALDNAINMGGLIQAHGGTVVLDGGNSGVVQVNNGTVDVSNSAGQGGTVILSGQYVGVLNGATINASGTAGGGKVIVGGDQLNKVTDLMPVRLADKTVFDSSSKIDISSSGGDGGFVETSGQAVNIEGAILGNAKGKAGQWLIDPTNLFVVNAAASATVSGGAPTNAFTADTTKGSYVLDSAISASNVDVTLSAVGGDIYSDTNVKVNKNTINVTFTSVNAGIAGDWTVKGLIFNTTGTAGILGAVTGNIYSSADNGADIRLYSIGSIAAGSTVTVDSGKTFSIYTDKSNTRTVANDFVLNGGEIKTGGVDGIATGGNYSRSNGIDMVHIFTGNGTFDNSNWGSAKNVDYLLVGGGGGGGSYFGGGGGAGRLVNGTISTAVNIYDVAVGSGGSGGMNAQGNNGGDSSFSTIVAKGGGGGGSGSGTGRAGGSSGGNGYQTTTTLGPAPSQTIGNGSYGGRGSGGSTSTTAGGGGGGAGSAGGNASSGTGGAGGSGLPSNITGINVNYAAGGGGAAEYRAGSKTGGAGGSGIGGNGTSFGSTSTPGNGLNGTGSGGGGASYCTTKGGDGGSGIAVLRYGIDSGTNATTVTLTGGISLTTGTTSKINAGADNAQINVQGIIDGDGNINICSSAANAATTKVVLTAANTYTGTTTVSNGTLQVGNGTAGSIANTSAITNNANLIFNRSEASAPFNFDNDLGSAISGTGNTTIIVGAGINIDADIAQGNITVNGKAGDVNINNVVCATAATFVNTTNGNINVNENLSGYNVVLKAGDGSAAGTVAGGNVAIATGKNINVDANGVLTVFSGDIANLVDFDNAIIGADSAGGAYRIATFNTAAQSHSTAGTRNYDLRTVATGNVSEISATKTYDGNSNAAGVLNYSGVAVDFSRGLSASGGDNISVTAKTANFTDNTGAETSHVLNATGLNVSFNQSAGATINVSGNQWQVLGADIANYSNATSGGTIVVRSVTVNLTQSADKTYDGKTDANGAAFTRNWQAQDDTNHSGVLTSESLNLSIATANYSDKNVSNAIAINLTDVQVADSTGRASDYAVILEKADGSANVAINATASNSVDGYVSGNISKRSVTVNLSDTNGKTYDGSTSANYSAFTQNWQEEDGVNQVGLVGTEKLNLSFATANYSDKNVSTSIGINLTDVQVVDATGLERNYDVKLVTTDGSANTSINATSINSLSGYLTGNISQRTVYVNLTGSADKTYDGKDSANIAKYQQNWQRSAGNDDTGLVGSENLNLSFTSANYTDIHACTSAINVNLTGAKVADLATDGGYEKNYKVVLTKADDSSVNATVSNATNSNVLSGYVTGNIAKRVVYVDAVTDSKTYDGTYASNKTVSIVANTTDTGLIGSDNLVNVSQAFNTAHAGSATLVANIDNANITGSSVGSLLSDYNVTVNQTVTGTIAQKVVNVQLNDITKTYDATKVATANGGTTSDLVGADSITGVSGTGTYNSQDVATANRANFSGLTASAVTFAGAANGTGNGTVGNEVAGNVNDYAFSFQDPANANISKASLTIAVKDATVTQGSSYTPEYAYSGLQGGETAAGLGISPTLSGTSSTATPGSYVLSPVWSGALDNYVVAMNNGTLTVTAVSTPSSGSTDSGSTISGETTQKLTEQGVSTSQISQIDQLIGIERQKVDVQAKNPEAAQADTVQPVQVNRDSVASGGTDILVKGDGINLAGLTAITGGTPAPAEAVFAPRDVGSMSRTDTAQWLNQRSEVMKNTLAQGAALLESNPNLASANLPACGAGNTDVCIPERNQEFKRDTVERKRALLIGVGSYQDSNIPELISPAQDIRLIGQALRDDLGYQAVEVVNPSKEEVIRALKRLSEESGPGDSVVVYFAGHGYHSDKAGDYWLPSNAQADDPKNWISGQDITRMLKATGTERVLLMSDSAAAGATLEKRTPKAGQQALVISSGTEPVADKAQDGYSVFATALSKALKSAHENDKPSALYEQVRREIVPVLPQAPQTGVSSLSQ